LGALALELVASLSVGGQRISIGGVEARRLPVLSVLPFSQPVGLAAAAVGAPSAGGPPPPLLDLLVAVAAGVASAPVLGALYVAMARSMIGLASPIGATGVRSGHLRPFSWRVAESVAAGGSRACDRRRASGRASVVATRRARDARRGQCPARRRRGAWLRCNVRRRPVHRQPQRAVGGVRCRAGGCGVIVAGALLAHPRLRLRELDAPCLATIGALGT